MEKRKKKKEEGRGARHLNQKPFLLKSKEKLQRESWAEKRKKKKKERSKLKRDLGPVR